jgi:homoserine dehydrogenase
VSSCFRVALLGFGTVGSAVAQRLTASNPDAGLRLTHIFDRRADGKRHLLNAASAVRWTSDIDDILHSDADIVVEAVGGLDPATGWIRDALLAGKSVVTANKQIIAAHGADLLRLAARQGRQLRFEAAVGGAMPIIRAIGDGLSGDRITRIVAILNGTTNAVLSQMEADDCSLACALAGAQAAGYAEADPSTDLDGGDARAKLAILCALAFGVRVTPSQIAARTSATISTADVRRFRDRRQSIRQIAFADYDRDRSTLTTWVAPTAVSSDSLLGRTIGPRNAALITGEHSGEVGLFGAGAGGAATAVAVLSDIVAIARDPSAIVSPLQLTANFSVQSSDFRLPEASSEPLPSDFTLQTSVYAEAL